MGERREPDTKCIVRYRCMVCKIDIAHDAYDGAPSCLGLPSAPHPKTLMRPCSLLMPNPDAEDMRGARSDV